MSRTVVTRNALGANSIRFTGIAGDVTNSNDYVDIPAPTDLDRTDLSAQSWLLFSWIYVRSLATAAGMAYSMTILGQLDTGDGSAIVSGPGCGRTILSMSLNSSGAGVDQLRSNLAGGSYESLKFPTLNTWIGSCLFWDFDTKTLHFNMDGVATNSYAGVNIESSTGKIRLGATKTPNRCFDGNIGPTYLLTKPSGNFSDSDALNIYRSRDLSSGTVRWTTDMIQSSGDLLTSLGYAPLQNGAAWDLSASPFSVRSLESRTQPETRTVV